MFLAVPGARGAPTSQPVNELGSAGRRSGDHTGGRVGASGSCVALQEDVLKGQEDPPSGRLDHLHEIAVAAYPDRVELNESEAVLDIRSAFPLPSRGDADGCQEAAELGAGFIAGHRASTATTSR